MSFLAHGGVAQKGEAHRLSCHMRVTQKMSGSAIKNQVHNKTLDFDPPAEKEQRVQLLNDSVVKNYSYYDGRLLPRTEAAPNSNYC